MCNCVLGWSALVMQCCIAPVSCHASKSVTADLIDSNELGDVSELVLASNLL